VTRDDRTSIQPTVIAFQELSQDPEMIAMIGPTTSGAGMAVRQIINDNRLPELSIAYGTALTQSNFKYYYRVGPSLETGNQALLNAIQKHRGDGQKLATLALSDAGGTDGAPGCGQSRAQLRHDRRCQRELQIRRYRLHRTDDENQGVRRHRPVVVDAGHRHQR
ncbi:ABC transporter substrate-binding protein, partial [Xanthomonas citri pv. citri]